MHRWLRWGEDNIKNMRIQGFPYEYFDGIDYNDNNFIKTFLVKKESFICDGTISKDEFVNDCDKCIEIFKQEKTNKEVVSQSVNTLNDSQKIILAHAVWLWAFPVDINPQNAIDSYGLNVKVHNGLNVVRGVAGRGQSTSQKPNDIKFILEWFKTVWNMSDISDIKKKYEEKYKTNDESIFSKNMILHLCNPGVYEPIGRQDDKKSIAQTFDPDFKDNTNESIKKVRSQLSYNKPSFYADGFKHFWKKEDKLNDDFLKLLYKKAMILYGPPGTGKTYVATDLANELIGRKFAEAYKQSKKKSIIDEFFKKNIFRLQLHVNYTYEDFVAGMVIKNNSTNVQEGYIYKVIERANELNNICPDLPVVVILDEINRTDISRVFGELFSAIEKRGETIDLSLQENGQPKQICIPNNVYFIGTMNEIDFSLERVDFALRRRFIWLLKTYEENILNTILKEKDHEDIVARNYVSLCTKLNNAITYEQDLGEKFVIGHAFFSEIANIMDDLSLDYDKARHMLWEISIYPTLEAYCGSMDKRKQDEFIEKCATAFDFEYKDGKVSLKSTVDSQTPNQPTTESSLNGTTKENSTVSADE